jgi:hypothetical protein
MEPSGQFQGHFDLDLSFNNPHPYNNFKKEQRQKSGIFAYLHATWLLGSKAFNYEET